LYLKYEGEKTIELENMSNKGSQNRLSDVSDPISEEDCSHSDGCLSDDDIKENRMYSKKCC
jgi:hypothetical protein